MAIKISGQYRFIRIETIILVLIIILSAVVRFTELGYSHYYGDEIKTLYLDKTVPASEFFLDQRKGPVQFAASWFMEKISGGYDPQWIRFLFALVSVLSVLTLFLVVKKMFGEKPALISASIFAFSGFSVAFGRTAQYQSFLMFFGFLSILFALYFKDTGKKAYVWLSAFFWVLAFYSHYDAIFFLIPILYIVATNGLKKSLLFVVPSLVLLVPFYLPYIVQGFMAGNTLNYVLRRVSGEGYLPNNSIYTISVYNPLYLFFVLLLPSVLTIFLKLPDKKFLGTVWVWFLISFVFYEIIIKNPGTHIQNYIVPLILLAGVSLNVIFKNREFVLLPVIAIYAAIALFVYTPSLNTGYPWKETRVLGIEVPKVHKKYQLFLYGFPYNRGWDQISVYFKSLNRVSGVFTNDNEVVASYYLLGVPYTRPGPNFLPEYYIHVLDSQEIDNPKENFLSKNLESYSIEKTFYVGDKEVSQLYHLK